MKSFMFQIYGKGWHADLRYTFKYASPYSSFEPFRNHLNGKVLYFEWIYK